MVSSAEVAILIKVAELAQRFGLRPSDADADIYFVNEEKDPEGKGYFGLSFGGWPTDPEKSEKFGRFASALGIEQDHVKADELWDLENIVDRALSMAPRGRAR